ncbi:hypothetical protein FOZ61_006888 [Perkinsus olseni]|uniref:Uncharacterized protein n=1 Tax=Perkinsus olseni TaxID=32597 RepID=A0A7J6MQ64_PEROL|nr:hypothetical protein FOZ61_006888 [Perkinsus olseni]KAF4673739.1 hypothetical protein FOL46_006598 [Perkinsus olseni]
MAFARFAVAATLACVPISGLHAAGNSQTHDPLAGIAQRLQSLSSQFDRINDHINDWIAKKEIASLEFGEGRFTDVYFAEESASPNPIVGYVYRQDVPGQAAKRPSVYVTAAYINDCSSLIIANTKDMIAISDNLAAARQHFSPSFLLGHLDEHALGKLRSALPITPVDTDKCAAIFATILPLGTAEFINGLKTIHSP